MTGILTVLVVLFCLVGVGYILWRPHWAVVPVIVLFPLEQLLQAYFPQLLGSYSWVVNVSVGSLALFAVLSRISRGERVMVGYGNPVVYLGWTLYLFLFIGLLWTPSRNTAWDMLSFGIPYYLLGIGLLPLLVNDLAQFRRILTGVMFVGCIIAVLILLNPRSSYYGGRFTLDLGMYSGQRGGRGNPLALAEMGAMMALIAALVRPAGFNLLFNFLRIAALILGLGLAIGSGSRGQVLAGMVAGLLFFPLSRRIANPVQFFLGVFAFGAMIGLTYLTFSLFIGAQNVERWSIESMISDIGLRFDTVWILLSEYLVRPHRWLFGLGPNAFQWFTGGADQPYVHNIAAEVLCEDGLVGATLLLAIMWFSYKYARQLLARHSIDPMMRAAAALLAAIVVYNFFLALKQGSILGSPTVFVWFFLLARICNREQLVGTEGSQYESDADELWIDDDHEHDYPPGDYTLAQSQSV